MKAKDFLSEFDSEHFPSSFGPEIGIEAHDPPFTIPQLRSMEKQGLIVISEYGASYRLTLKASKVSGRDV